MRKFLLRSLIGWWMIPIVWTFVFAIGFLLSGWDEAVDGCKVMTDNLWNGI